MKLQELLSKIPKPPYSVSGNDMTIMAQTQHGKIVVADCVRHEEKVYLKHAANVLPEVLEALKYTEELIKCARQYFPKSIKHRDKFKLENTCAAVTKARIHAEEVEDL